MSFVFVLIQGITILVIVDAIASWFIAPGKFPRNITGLITEPLYRPIRAILSPERLGGIDISPLVVIFALQGLQRLLAAQLPM